ncbi:HRDC domain-containing protein [Paenibacillus sp. GCM10027626]|uniref:HRDC domain-containing protein n=1 Tax=Paenibacillus sp. GCM10027626 TaxID=3273411 RepID=UPI003638FC2A
MQIVFLNTFEKVVGDSQSREAALTISEREGIWFVQWAAGEPEQELWYEGGYWEELLASFRHGIAVKMGEGYVPIIDGMLDDRRAIAGEGSLRAKLQCYGELHANAALFEALREWRRAHAVIEKKTAYMIANNRMLWMISAYVPHTLEQLRQIPGWGEGKQASYGEEIIQITGQYEQPRSFPLDWVMDEIDPDQYAQWLFKQKETKFKAQMGRHQKQRLLLELLKEGKSLEQMQEQLELPRREVMERIERLDLEGYDVEPLIERELKEMPEAEQQLVWDALTIVGDKYLKPVMHSVYGEEPAAGASLDKLYDRLRLIRLRYRRMRPDAG